MNNRKEQDQVDINGVYPIMAPPFQTDGEIDWADFRALIGHLSKSGIQGLTMFGIASEFYKFTDFERKELAAVFVHELKGTGVRSVLSVTDHSTEVAVKRAKEYQAIGADALMLLPPFFLHPSMEAIKEHIRAVLSAVTIPVLVQYAPSETNVEIAIDELIEIYDAYPNVVFKIESNPPMDTINGILQERHQAIIMNGYAGLYMLDVMKAGGSGVMPGCSFAEIYVEIYRLSKEGLEIEARQLHQKLLVYISCWMKDCEYIIQVEKNILQQRGLIKTDYCRKPSYPLSQDDLELIQQFLAEFGSLLHR
ncbi:dihydrodipicolinate synthase family protein [Paenibacillus pectinilyticus]|uniref:Dihydrodipicolinate synthase family protein n=1 Tax=Paenibacillus pectinilyticus TaxID=512399 RepID=A0A1C0ZRT0_9BACL|nr:dihydrodipicolinate synthase family protein [Paenibacillus pectinilyticus]OCT10769.1 dihydrodipicolinate synthase family protein [Paenibacillus pectinilyticus]